MGRKVLLIGGNSLAGRTIAKSLENDVQIVPTAGHHTPKDGYQLAVEEPDKLIKILSCEDPEIVISSVGGDYQAQMKFHEVLADWLVKKERRLLYISSANVFDGDLSGPWTENDLPSPGSNYGKFKRDCEIMLGNLLGKQLTIFRLAAVWSRDCPRVQQLDLHGRNREPHCTYPGYMINVTFAGQVGEYARYVLNHNLHGIFHVGTIDTVDYLSFEKMVCGALKIELPQFLTEETSETVSFAILPTRKEIPNNLQMTILDVLAALKANSASDL